MVRGWPHQPLEIGRGEELTKLNVVEHSVKANKRGLSPFIRPSETTSRKGELEKAQGVDCIIESINEGQRGDSGILIKI